SKVWLLLFTSALATLGAAFRIYTGYAPRPASNPAWYHGRACYYCFNYVTDLIISAAYLFSRFDRRFIVPNGAKGPGDYGKAVRARPPSIASSDGGEENGNDTDPEKLARLRGDSNEDGREKAAPPVYCHDGKDNGKGKGKGKDIGTESDDKGPALAVDNSTQTMYGSGGDWYPWPFRASWAMQHNRELMPSMANQFSEGDNANIGLPPANYSPVDGPPPQEASSQWGGETSTTYIQEPDPAHSRPAQRQFQPHQLQQHGRPHTLGQAYSADEALNENAASPPEPATAWPFISETAATGRNRVTGEPSRSRSIAGDCPTSGIRGRSRSRINRSLSCKEAEILSPTGGWI
ncbi:hypothetical protein CHU98_g4422, partial [Xylaria longipes]